MADSPAQFAKVFKAANTVVRPLLGSSLHGVLSGRLMLLEYTGAKTGRFARRNGPRAARGLMLGLPGGRQPDRGELLAAAAKTTITRFALTSPDDTGPDDT